MVDSSIAYLASLRRHLEFKVSSQKADDLVKEIESHLMLVRAELEQGGMSPDAAEREAILRMGPDRLLAEDLARSAGGWSRSMLAYTVLPSLLLAIALYATTQPSTISGYYWVLSAAVAMFIWQAARSQKWIAFPISALFFVIVMGVVVQQGLSWKNSAVPYLRMQAAQIEMKLVQAEQAMNGIALNREGKTVLAPQRFDRAPGYSPFYALIKIDEAREKRLWATHGKGYVSQLRVDLRETRKSIEAKFSWGLVLKQSVLATGVLLAVLAGINALILLASTGRRRVLENRWRVA